MTVPLISNLFLLDGSLLLVGVEGKGHQCSQRLKLVLSKTNDIHDDKNVSNGVSEDVGYRDATASKKLCLDFSTENIPSK